MARVFHISGFVLDLQGVRFARIMICGLESLRLNEVNSAIILDHYIGDDGWMMALPKSYTTTAEPYNLRYKAHAPNNTIINKCIQYVQTAKKDNNTLRSSRKTW